ncbi:MAG TPA: TfoX/Sxy family protein [Rhodocyclaceae bacterium]|nr:TfoX/Sxy family protein [Rhodocyclaceae bacterium]
MANSNDFVAFVLEQMSTFGPVSAKRMFGGHGLYLDSLMFALIDDDRLYLKVDDQTRADFVAKQTKPFTYQRQGEAASLSYYEAPPEVFDDKADMLLWARKAYATALRKRPSSKQRKVKP